MREAANIWIRLVDGRDICMHYSRTEIAWQARRSMLDAISHGEPVQCIHGEIPARDVKRVDFVADTLGD